MTDRRTLDRRIKNLARTKQITYAMHLIASIKLKRVQKAAQGGKHYIDELSGAAALVTKHGTAAVDEAAGKVLILVASDRGFAGNANQLVADFFKSYLQKCPKDSITELITLGRHAHRIAVDAGLNPALSQSLSDTPDAVELAWLSQLVEESIVNYPGRAVDLISLRFVSLGRQYPAVTGLYPPESGRGIDADDYWFEPMPDVAKKAVMSRLISATLLSLLREAKASEHVIRMRAMRQATDSAGEMLGRLTRERSRLRQQQITQEILEIVADASVRRYRVKERHTDD